MAAISLPRCVLRVGEIGLENYVLGVADAEPGPVVQDQMIAGYYPAITVVNVEHLI